jgi:hypothetical protein
VYRVAIRNAGEMRDIDVRRAVRQHLDAAHGDDPNTWIVEEMGIWAGSVRVDIAVINGEFQGIELKSARDTLERLPRQASLYNEVFDKVILVIAEKHIAKARTLVPYWWGFRAVSTEKDGSLRLEDVYESAANPSINPIQVARLLWRSEGVAALEKYGLAKGLRSKTAEVIASKLAAELPLNTLRFEARAAIKAREAYSGKTISNQRHMPIQ